MAKLLCTITTKVYSDGKVEVSTEPYKDPDVVEEAKRIALGTSNSGLSMRDQFRENNKPGEKGIFGLGDF